MARLSVPTAGAANLGTMGIFTCPTMIQILGSTTFSIPESSRQIITTTFTRQICAAGSGSSVTEKESAFFANIYTAEEKEELEAVGFYATGENTSYQVYTVTDAEGSSQFGRRRKVASGEVANAGYYTVLLDKTMTLEAGERFAVIVEITTPGAIHPVAIEYSSPDKGLTVDLSDGEGYISYRGSSWERVETEQNCNVCLKAYTRNVDS